MDKMVREEKKPIESKPSDVINVGEKYELVTGIDENKAGGLDSRLMPNLHKRWIPSDHTQGMPYNAQLYKNASEQEFYEGFIQPLYQVYKTGQFRKGMNFRNGIFTHNWEKHVNLEALGPEKYLFKKADGRKSACIGEIEVTLILVTHLLDDLYKYRKSKIARRFGATVEWVGAFKKRIQSVYGKLAQISLEDHLEKQLGRCESLLDTYMERAKDGDHYAAKIVKDFMDKEDQYIMPTVEQLPAKETEEERSRAIKRLEDIFERKRIEGKTITDIERIETTPERIKEAFEYQKGKDENEKNM
ncbi:MAG: hypothetical protein ACFE9S_07630 [Candidatus Hermodarchaeota archaeon]